MCRKELRHLLEIYGWSPLDMARTRGSFQAVARCPPMQGRIFREGSLFSPQVSLRPDLKNPVLDVNVLLLLGLLLLCNQK